jgi:hypothetical protein
MIDRILDDDYMHEQVTAAGARVRDAYRRARRLPPRRAVQDQTVYENVRGAVAAGIEAVRRALGKPEPKPKRRGRRLLLALVAAAGAAFAVARRQRAGGERSGDSDQGAGAAGAPVGVQSPAGK